MQKLEPEVEELEYMDNFSEEKTEEPFDNEFDDAMNSRLLMAIQIVKTAKGITWLMEFCDWMKGD